MSEALLNLYLRREPGGYKYDEDRTVCRHEISGSSRTLGCKFCLVGNPHLIPSRARRVINTISFLVVVWGTYPWKCRPNWVLNVARFAGADWSDNNEEAEEEGAKVPSPLVKFLL